MIDGTAFPFQLSEEAIGCGSWSGHVIVVPNGRAGWKVWIDEVFADEATANVTAARCINGPCDILPAKEVIHYAGKPCSFNFRRSILVDWTRMEKAA
ncbi:hypothetical protein LP421_07890 [Rhizobium sp. RCAM05350]|nr:hypothetical protein LP421_07890 [Rhizobium sp. RCAM05350]